MNYGVFFLLIHKLSFCSGGGSEARLGDDAGQPLAASGGAPASVAIRDHVDSIFKKHLDRVEYEKTVRRVSDFLLKQPADAALQPAQKKKSKPRQPGAPFPEHPSLKSPEGEMPRKRRRRRRRKTAKSCAKPAAIGAAPSSGSQHGAASSPGSQEV